MTIEPSLWVLQSLELYAPKIDLFNYIELYNITCDQMYDEHLQDDHLRNIEKLVAPSILQLIKQTAFNQVIQGNISISYIDRIPRNDEILPVIKGIILTFLISIANENKLSLEEFCYNVIALLGLIIMGMSNSEGKSTFADILSTRYPAYTVGYFSAPEISEQNQFWLMKLVNKELFRGDEIIFEPFKRLNN